MASTNSIEMENQKLKAKIQDFINELDDKENQVILSAQFGKQLLESNSELNRQLEEIQESNLAQLEELRQENYSMKMKIAAELRAKENFAVEMDNLKLKLQEDAKQELCCVTANHNKKVEELEREIEVLHGETERNALVIEQLQEKVSKQDEMLAEAYQYSKQLQDMGVLETAMEELKEECALMRFANDELKISLHDANDTTQQLSFDKQNLVEKLESLKENFEQKSMQANAWFDALQDSRQHVSELQMEVSVLKAELLNKSHKKKGNSLFGEVEDKRLELEQKFLTISTKYESLQKTHQIVKRQLHQYKSQILPMLQMAGNQADSSKLKRLEAALSQSQSEIQRLYVKIKDLEKEKKDQDSSTRLEKLHDAVIDSKGKKDYVAFLQSEIARLKEMIENLKSKEEITTVKLLAETDKRRETESILHTCEVKKERLEHDAVRLRLKLEEMKIKLHQEGKLSEQLREPMNASKNRRSIWQDSGLFTRKEKQEILPKVSRSANLTENSVTKIENTNQANVTESVELNPVQTLKSLKPSDTLPSKDVGASEAILTRVTTTKVKPVGRVAPLNGTFDKENENDCSVENTSNESCEEERENVREIPPLIESNNEVSQPEDIPNERRDVTKRKQDTVVAKQERKRAQKLIHVKKDVGTKNECHQQ